MDPDCHIEAFQERINVPICLPYFFRCADQGQARDASLLNARQITPCLALDFLAPLEFKFYRIDDWAADTVMARDPPESFGLAQRAAA